MQDKELSQWFDINVQKPWEPGVYLVDEDSFGKWFSYWDGKKFGYLVMDVNEAIEEFSLHTDFVVEKWRGLALNPASTAKPKPKGNRKVTRYVCVYGIFNNPCAVFNTKKEAEKHVNSGKSWGYTKIRFRTPES